MNLTKELVLEFSRLGLVYVHLIACCVALGLVLKSDVVMLRDMIKGDRASDLAHMKQMNGLQSIVSMALAALWVTGVALVTMDALTKDGLHYFANPKIQTKILVVSLLTLNGFALHNLVLPWLQKAGSLVNLSFNRSAVTAFTGSVSAVSWMYAAFMGIGRPLSWKYSLGQLMAAYPLMVAGGFITMMALISWAKQRNNPSVGHEANGFAMAHVGSR
jgi:hypothetical protein